jgi:predicted O-methyltransferase YrrM
MKPHEVRKLVGDVPHMTLKQGLKMTEFIHRHGIKDILELGFSNGVSTCYLAAALDEIGGGRIVTIDKQKQKNNVPNIEQLLDKVGLQNLATWYYEPTSYLWALMKFLEEEPIPMFDLCYVDGAHSWYADGFAFFLVDRLLRPGGWIIFDDLDWTYATSPALKGTDWVRSMPQEERGTPQVRKIYDLLVRTHPCYGDFTIDEGWAFAHKIADSVKSAPPVRHEFIVRRGMIPLADIESQVRRLLRRINPRKST